MWVLTLGSPPTARPQLASKYSESQAVLSPDARAIAYVSDESGRSEMARPVRLFQLSLASRVANRHQYQPTANADRFLVNVRAPLDVDPPMTVLLNWPAVTDPVESPRQ